MSRTVAELVVRGVAHLVVVVVAVRGISMTSATSAVTLEVTTTGVVALDGVVRLAAEVSTGLLGTESVGVRRNGALPHVALEDNMLAPKDPS